MNKSRMAILTFGFMQTEVELEDDEYTVPEIPIPLPTFTDLVPFGAAMKKEMFLVDSKWTFLNHAAFGCALRPAVEVKQKWQLHIEAQPLRFMDRELMKLLIYVIRDMAEFVNCDPRDLVLPTNVTSANNSVIKSVAKKLSPGDRIAMLNLTYGSTKKIVRHVANEYGLEVDELVITFPIYRPSEIVTAIANQLHKDTKLAIFDHIASDSAIILPAKELVELCHDRGIEVLIDGAHGLGGLPLDLREIDADYYGGNTHKWLSSPKGGGILYVKRCHQEHMKPLVISHGFGCGFTPEFMWSGNMDFTTHLSLLTVLSFWRHYGTDNIRAYMYSLARKAGEILTESWGTSLLAGTDMFGSMVTVALPSGVLGLTGTSMSIDNAEAVQNALYERYNIEVPIRVIQGKLYVRVSAHVHNEEGDYHKLAAAIKELIQQAN